MLYSGTLDSFGIPRQQYRMLMPTGESFIDAIVRYASLYNNDRFDAVSSLFGDSEEMKPQRPELPPLTGEIDDLEFLQMEKELVGMYLSSHPLDKYKLEIDNFTNCSCGALNDVVAAAQAAKKPCMVNIAGCVKSFEKGTTQNGKNWGRVVLEDFEGSFEFRLNSRQYEDFAPMMQVHNNLFIEGYVDEKFRVSPEERKEKGDPDYGFKIKKISLLSNVAEQLIKEFKISLVADGSLNMDELLRLLKENKGLTPVTVLIIDPKTGHGVDFQCRKFKVRPNIALTDALDRQGLKWRVVK